MILRSIQDHGTAAFHQTDDDHDLTPLHILTRYNGFASDDVIIACFAANPMALFAMDTNGGTPLDDLWKDSKIDVIVQMMQVLCIMNHNRRVHVDNTIHTITENN